MALIQEGSGNVPQQAFVRWNDPVGNELAAVNRDGTIFSQGVRFQDGTEQTTASSGGGSSTIRHVSVPYTITAGDSNNLFANIPVTFPIAFADNSYDLTFTVEIVKLFDTTVTSGNLNTTVGLLTCAMSGIVLKTAAGFTALLEGPTSATGSWFTTGDTIIIHAIGVIG
jgi:hypothetical protein